MAARPRIELDEVPARFSFSMLLTGILQDEFRDIIESNIIVNGRLIDPVHIIALALNEEGRVLKRGSFYYLPSREDITYGHPCDLVFIDEVWIDNDCYTWDSMSWTQRLDFCVAVDSIQGWEAVIPICARILGHDPVFDTTDDKSLPGCQLGDTVDKWYDDPELSGTATESNTSILSTRPSSVTSSMNFASFDPAVKSGRLAYSRPIEDVSTYLIHYEKLPSATFLCRSAAAEHHSLCQSFPTPGDISETFVRNTDLTTSSDNTSDTQRGVSTAAIAARAAQLVFEGQVPTIADVLWHLIVAWDDESEAAIKDSKYFGGIKYRWCELEDRINSDRNMRDIAKITFWPMT